MAQQWSHISHRSCPHCQQNRFSFMVPHSQHIQQLAASLVNLVNRAFTNVETTA